jgi:hypothetical protein
LMVGKVEKEMAIAALGGDASDYVRIKLRAGLVSFLAVRQGGATAIEAALSARSARSHYAQVGLRFGAKLRLPFRPSQARRLRVGGQQSYVVTPAVVIVKGKKSDSLLHLTCDEAVAELAQRCGSHVQTTVKVLFGIERARLQALALMEEGTRWL